MATVKNLSSVSAEDVTSKSEDTLSVSDKRQIELNRLHGKHDGMESESDTASDVYPEKITIDIGTQSDIGYKKGDNGWDDSIEKRIMLIQEYSQGYGWMHKRSAQKKTTIHKYLVNTSMIVPGLVSLFQSIELLIGSEDPFTISFVKGVILFMGFLGVTIASVQKSKQLPTQISEHKKGYLMWYKHANRLAAELSKPAANRKNGMKFLKWADEKYEELKEKTTFISQEISGEYKSMVYQFNKDLLEDLRISIPPMANGVIKAFINHSTDKIEDSGEDIPVTSVRASVSRDRAPSITDLTSIKVV